MSWVHRLTGVLLLLYVIVHVYTLSHLTSPPLFTAKMAAYGYGKLYFSFLEWALALPLVLHALNGLRIILYEIFGVRSDQLVLRWVAIFSLIYVLTLAYPMFVNNQQISAEIFWLATTILSATVGYIVYRKVWGTANSVWWKLQRISGALLLPLASAHMFFMHMNPSSGHDAAAILLRLQGYSTKAIDFLFFALILFHGTYGCSSIINDYIRNRYLRRFSVGITVVVMTICGFFGLRFLITI